MSNRERAAEIIRQFLNGKEPYSTMLRNRLDNAGLLAPDLPEPGTYASGEIEWATLDGYVNVENGLITVSHDERTEDDTPEQRERLHVDDGQIIITNPATAEHLGHLLIAAARTQRNNHE